jgi:quinol monooxygenase YgiN/ketosteroid isomerase-like protein
MMPIYQTGGYQVKASAVNKVRKAIDDFVLYVHDHEPGTQMYLAWQEKHDPTRFLHLFIFADAAAQSRHGRSEAVQRFESVYSPELVGGDVVFTDYEMVAGKRDAFGTSESAAALEQFYGAVVKRDLTAARTYLADNLVFVGLFETYRGADEYLKALAGLLEITIRLEVQRVIGQGDNAAVFFELETKSPAEGKVLVAEWHQFKDGKIAHVRSAFDGRPYAALFTSAGRK